jgi:hypothetical protein
MSTAEVILTVVNAVLNVVQAVALAYIGVRYQRNGGGS